MIKRKDYFQKKRIFQKEQIGKEGKEDQLKKKIQDNHPINK